MAWRNLAESIEKSELKKGDRIYLEGKIRTHQWTDKDGNKRSSIEIVTDTFTIITRKKDRTAAAATATTADEENIPAAPSNITDSENLPF